MTSLRRNCWIGIGAFVLATLAGIGSVQAYIDPGTQAAVAGSLVGFLAMFAGFFGIVLWPFRKLVDFMCKRTGLPRLYGKILIIAMIIGGIGYLVHALDQRWHFLTSGESSDSGQIEAPIAVSYAKFDRVMLLGMDGLDAGILEEMMDAGQLPSFKKLKETGAYARLRTSNPPQSPVAWSCIATGCNPGKHGIFDFILRDPNTYIPELAIYKTNTSFTSRENRYLPTRDVPGFWRVLSKGGVPTVVIRWPNAFPPPQVNGRFFSGLGVPDICDRMGRYSLYTTNDKCFAAGNSPNKMVKVAWDGEKVTTSLFGPKENDKLPLVLTKKGKRVALDLDGKAAGEIGVGEWTGWATVKFGGMLGGDNGIVRFLLIALEPDLKLYATPIQVDPMAPLFPITYPDAYARELAEKIGRYFTVGMPEDVKALSEHVFTPENFLSMCGLIQVERDAMFKHELARFEKGLFAFVYDSTDRKQHMFWAARDPEHPAYTPEYAAKYKDVIPGVYKRMDDLLGKVMGGLGEKTALIVLSDHGFTTYRKSVNLNTWLVQNGYQTRSSPDGKAFFQDVDWSNTKAYSLGFNSIYINLEGREGRGIVKPGSDYRQLCGEIAEKLRSLRDPKGDKPVIRNVYQAREIYRGDAMDMSPDLVVGLVKGYRAGSENVLGAAPKDLFEINDKPWSGSHLYDPYYVPGIFLTNQKIRTDNPGVMDVAPSVLQCFGIAKPDYMDGEALFDFGG
ncbi:MAG: alkaline phosphatase family protein [Phycisphaerae bacterium]|nr:alkaline phosphatase family protein [Phycisphaerae bacterium]